MERLQNAPTPRLLQFAFAGYALSEEEEKFLERAGWARALPRSVFPPLRRTRVLSWNAYRLEAEIRDFIPTSHPIVRWSGQIPFLKIRRDRRLQALSDSLTRCNADRQALMDRLNPLQVAEREQLQSYRPVSEATCLRLTEEGKKALCAYRFSDVPLTESLHLRPLELRLERLAALYHSLPKQDWWTARLRSAPYRRQQAEADALWLSFVLSSRDETTEEGLERAEAAYRGFTKISLWWHDPLPLCLILLASERPRAFDAIVETSNALTRLGWEAGYEMMSAATALVAAGPASDLEYRIAEFHRFWRLLVAYGLGFSHLLHPSAARLSTARRPVERTATLLRAFDGGATRFDRMSDTATRLAATFLADLALDNRDRGEGADLFAKEEPYALMLLHRYRSLRAAILQRCRFEASPEEQATILAGLLAPCPGSADSLVELYDSTRRLVAGIGLPPEVEPAWLPALLLEARFEPVWEVSHARFAGELYRFLPGAHRSMHGRPRDAREHWVSSPPPSQRKETPAP